MIEGVVPSRPREGYWSYLSVEEKPKYGRPPVYKSKPFTLKDFDRMTKQVDSLYSQATKGIGPWPFVKLMRAASVLEDTRNKLAGLVQIKPPGYDPFTPTWIVQGVKMKAQHTAREAFVEALRIRKNQHDN